MKRSSQVFWLSVSTLLAGACLSTEESEPVSDMLVEGRVVDDDSGDGLGGAKVWFVSDVLDETETRTDGDGHFEMNVEVHDDVRFGTLRAELGGYRTSTAQTIYFDGTPRSLEIRLRQGGD